MLERIRNWIIFKIVGKKTLIANLPFPLVVPPGNHVIDKSILIKNSELFGHQP